MTETHHETEGVLSPLIRDVRLREIARRVPEGTRVLDLACGEGFLRRFLPSSCDYYGVDVLSPTDPEVFTGFLPADLLEQHAPDRILEWLGGPVDIITCAAFLEHIPDPGDLLKRCRVLLEPGGRIIGTTPHPRGRRVHDALARLYLCSRAGAADHEDFLSRTDLVAAAKHAGGHVVTFRTFLLGLNQLFEIQLSD